MPAVLAHIHQHTTEPNRFQPPPPTTPSLLPPKPITDTYSHRLCIIPFTGLAAAYLFRLSMLRCICQTCRSQTYGDMFTESQNGGRRIGVVRNEGWRVRYEWDLEL